MSDTVKSIYCDAVSVGTSCSCGGSIGGVNIGGGVSDSDDGGCMS